MVHRQCFPRHEERFDARSRCQAEIYSMYISPARCHDPILQPAGRKRLTRSQWHPMHVNDIPYYCSSPAGAAKCQTACEGIRGPGPSKDQPQEEGMEGLNRKAAETKRPDGTERRGKTGLGVSWARD